MGNGYIKFDNISKFYPGVKALSDISFELEEGKVTALIGENGAGKSTLLKILSGDVKPDIGTVTLNGEEVHFSNPRDAIKAGISVIYQERQLVPMMSVMENIFLDNLPRKKFGRLDKKELREKTDEIIAKFGIPIKATDLVGKLPIAYQQMVEIMKAYRRDSKVIAFDEPTAPLTEAEISVLFTLIDQLRKDGKVVIYVSHRMPEIFRLTDKIVVMKDGMLVREYVTSETTESELIKAMVGRDIGDTYNNLKRNDKYGDVVLEVKNLCTDAIHDISFSIRSGEVIGFAGLVGAGRTEVARALFGADKIHSGSVILKGEEVHFKSPYDAISHGVALCPEDRKEQGLVLSRSVKDNISMPVLKKVRKGLFLDPKQEKEMADSAVEAYSIRTPTIEKKTVELSGGNQQKVILGRWTSNRLSTDVLILDEPTKGIDVVTKAEIYQMVCDFAREGKAVIFISSELTEVINVCDQIIVMHNGHITGKLARSEATEENVLALAMLD